MYILQGHYRDEQGLMEIGRLLVGMHEGRHVDPYTNAPLRASLYEIVKGDWTVEIIGSGCAVFCPDRGECERIGMPVESGA